MKKKLLAVLAAAIGICAMPFSASAEEEYNKVLWNSYPYTSAEYYYDQDGDGVDDFRFYISLNTDTMEAGITDVAVLSDVTHFEIPSVVEDVIYEERGYDYYDKNGYWVKFEYEYVYGDFEVTSYYFRDYYCELYQITSAAVPYTVDYIDSQTLGYIYYNSFWDCKKVENYKIYCVENTAAHTYALNNGISCETVKNVSGATISLGSIDLTYDGAEKKPPVTVKYGGKTLAEGVDFYVEYNNNINAGTASACVYGTGSYGGCAEVLFEITPADASSAGISVDSAYYTGSAVAPLLTVTLNGKTLVQGIDFYTQSSYAEPGNATGTVIFTGNYTGQQDITFTITIAPLTNVKADATDSSITLSWDAVPCQRYHVYVYDTASKKFVFYKLTTATSLKITGLDSFTSYTYRVKAVKFVGSTAYTNDSVQIKTMTDGQTPTIMVRTYNNQVKISWNKVPRADGYKVYRSVDGGEYTLLKKIFSGSTTSLINKANVSNTKNYSYKVVAYKMSGSKAYYSEYSAAKDSIDPNAILNAHTLNRTYKFKQLNVQGAKTIDNGYYTLSTNDRKILQKFADTHFTSGMTREEKLRTTLEWIHYNVKYATGSDWNKISGKSYVEAVFSYKLGQCAQYNGAMAAMMAYMGYDVRLVQSYRGTPSNHWQHFWVEVAIGGRVYIMETGNYGKSGVWWYFLMPYSYTSGYMKNGKVVTSGGYNYYYSWARGFSPY